MRKIFEPLLILTLAGCADSNKISSRTPEVKMIVDYVKFQNWVSSSDNNGEWQTDWFDDFTDETLDRDSWNVLVGAEAEFNGESQWYVDEEGPEDNFWLADGFLHIQVQKETRRFDNKEKFYTSARLSTKNKVDRVGGAWEARLRFQASKRARGYWPAFWVLGSNVDEAPLAGTSCWPTQGAREIDLFEYTRKLFPYTLTNFVKGDRCGSHGYGALKHRIKASEWHTYRLEFGEGFVKIYIDGVEVRKEASAPFDEQDYHAILNIAMGNFGGQILWRD